MRGEVSQDQLVRMFFARRFPVPAQGAYLRKDRFDFGLHPLASQPILTEVPSAARGTCVRFTAFIATVMAEQSFLLLEMQGQRRFTIWTAQNVAAIAAEDV